MSPTDLYPCCWSTVVRGEGGVILGGDFFSRMIVARTPADTALVNNAVNTAIANRSRSGATILHVDCGTQFTSSSFGRTCVDGTCSARSAPSVIASITPPWSHSGHG